MKKLRIKISRPGDGFCVMDAVEGVSVANSEVEALSAGESVTFEGVEMTDEEFAALREFEGW